MCGIFGSYTKKNYSLDKFISFLNVRGPDEKKIVKAKNFIFGATRLSIRDLNRGSQPFYSSKYRLYWSLNGEIYNYVFLREILEKKGHKFETNCDTELIGPGYHYFNQFFFKMINGMFAISILDLNKREFVLARDVFGIKPLYYFLNKKNFFFSSSAKSIYNLNFFKKKINIYSFISILKHRYIKGNKHIFEGIQSVSPGEIIKFRPGTKLKKFIFEPKNEKINYINYQDKIKFFFNNQLKNYKLSDVDLSLLISSGIDSNILGHFLYDKSLKFYNINFIDNKFNETKILKKNINKNIKKKIKIINFSHKEFNRSIIPAINSFDSPISDGVIFPMYYLFRAIKKNNIKVSFSGEGADEIFGGYYYIKYFNIIKKINNRKIRFLLSKVIKKIPIKLLNSFFGYQGDFGDFSKKRLFLYFKKKNNFYNFNDLLSVFSDEELKNLLIDNSYIKNYKKQNSTKKISYNNIIEDLEKNWLPNYNCYKLDQVSMQNSVEARVPFLDNFFYNLLKFYKKNKSFYGQKKILQKILYEKFKVKILKKIAFQNYMNIKKKTLIISFAEKNINEKFKIFKILRFHTFRNILNNYKKSDELLQEKQFFSLFILSIWFEKET